MTLTPQLSSGDSSVTERPRFDSSGRRLFGREAEIAVLDQVVARIPERGGVLVLRGDAGIGKTALLAVASAEASSRGVSVLRAVGAQSEIGMAFAGLHQLLLPVLGGLDHLPAPQRDALAAAFGTVDVPVPDPFLIALGALNLLAEAAEQVPRLLVVDQAQWLDPPTASALAFVARRVEAEPIAVLFALRSGVANAIDAAGLPELSLCGLDDEAAGELLDEQGESLPWRLRQRVLAIAAGNPLALLELPGTVRLDDARADCVDPPSASLTSTLERAFAGQEAGLPSATRDVMLLAAADERAAATEVLAAASLMGHAEVGVDAVGPAEAAALAAIVDGAISFRHPLVGSAVYHSASAARRREAHASLAVVLADPDRRLWHRAASMTGPDESVAAEVEALSDRLARRGAVSIAAVAARRAAALTVDRARRCSRLLRAAELAFEMGESDLLQRLVLEAEQLSPNGEQRARLTWLRNTFAAVAPGDPNQMLSLIDAADVAANAGNSDLALHLLFGAGLRCWRSDLGDAARDRLAAAVEQLPVFPTDPRRVAILAIAGPVRWGSVVAERLRAIGAPDELAGDAAYLAGMAARAIGDHDAAARFLGSAALQLRAQGRLGVLASVLVMRGWVAIAQSDWSAAEVLGEEAGRLSQDIQQTWWHTGSLILRAVRRGLRGEAALAEDLVAEAERTAIPQRLNDLLCVAALARGITLLGAGRPADALEHLVRVFDRSDPAYHEAARFMAITYLVDAASQSGEASAATAILAELERLAQLTPSPTLRAGLVYARPILAEDDAAEGLFDAALRGDLRRHPFDHARLQLAYGAWLRRQRRVLESRAPLRAAREVFDALGCVPWGDRARHELRASGEQSRQRIPAARDQLTPQELQIAQMAATGLTNREIGQQLYLSPRTVASHLYRLFPKLGITSRGQLAVALDLSSDAAGVIDQN